MCLLDIDTDTHLAALVARHGLLVDGSATASRLGHTVGSRKLSVKLGQWNTLPLHSADEDSLNALGWEAVNAMIIINAVSCALASAVEHTNTTPIEQPGHKNKRAALSCDCKEGSG